MIRTLRSFFLSRALREKLLLVGFLGIAAVMWATAFSSRAGRFWRAQHATTVELKDQDFWLGQRGQIEAATHAAASQMDPAKTLDPTGLSVEISRMANESNLNVTRGNVTPDAAVGQFAINQMRLSINGAEWSAFRNFYLKLQARAPYIAIREIAMQPVPRNPSQVTATMTVVSFEVKK